MPSELVRDSISHDLVKALEELLDIAKSGEAVGLVFGLMFKRKRYIVDCAGEVWRNPTFARGVVCAIDDRLREMVHGKSFEETR